MKNETLVLLHGWGCDSRSWSPIHSSLNEIANVITVDLPGFGDSPVVDDFSLDVVVNIVASQLPDACVLVGWSLGGMLAVQIAARHPQKVSRLITLAANVKFVVDREYVTAMPLAVNQNFNKNFESDPAATLKLFAGLLAQGDSNERALLKKIRTFIHSESITSNWLPVLQLLSELDNRAAFSALTQSGLHIFGESDVLVPASAAVMMQSLNNRQKVHVLPETAHALHWSQPQKIVELISDFLQRKYFSSDDAIFKKRVAQSFSRAADTYDGVANFQRDVGEQLLREVTCDESASVVMDLGCGTGYFLESLQQKFPGANLVAVDMADGMLAKAKSRNIKNVNYICGDAEFLPFADESVDVIFSSLALQWCNNLEGLFSELSRILKPDGKIIISTLGPNTLHELKNAWLSVDNYVHVNQFKSEKQLFDDVQSNGFAMVDFKKELPVLEFEKLSDLTRELKFLGAHNVNRGQSEGLTGRKKIESFKFAYEKYRRNNLLPTTYEVFYVTAKKLSSPND